MGIAFFKVVKRDGDEVTLQRLKNNRAVKSDDPHSVFRTPSDTPINRPFVRKIFTDGFVEYVVCGGYMLRWNGEPVRERKWK